MTARDEALGLLTHYITLLMRRTGSRVDQDTHAELAQLVDALIAAARAANTGRIEP